MTDLPALPRLWPTIAVPGVQQRRLETYSMLDLDAMPPVGPVQDGSLGWLLRSQPLGSGSLQRSADDPVERDADEAWLAAVAPGLQVPRAFERFIADPEPRRHVRSATACYLDLGQFTVSFGTGTLVHFLSDQQWVLHWLLWVGQEGAEAVVVTPDPLGFVPDEGAVVRTLDPAAPQAFLAVCGDSFEEFLYRYWAMNELFYRLAVEHVELEALPVELRDFAKA